MKSFLRKTPKENIEKLSLILARLAIFLSENVEKSFRFYDSIHSDVSQKSDTLESEILNGVFEWKHILIWDRLKSTVWNIFIYW